MHTPQTYTPARGTERLPDGASRTIAAVLRKHDNEWFVNERGNCVLLTQVAHYDRKKNDPLHGSVTWITELDELTSIHQTLTLLGY